MIGTSKRHREQIIRHELAHMLLGHHVTSDTSAIVAVLSHLIDPDKIRAAFGRASYDTQQERDAELAASFLGEIIDNLPADNAGDNGLDDVLAHPRKRESGRYT
ncbi:MULTISPECIES: hypothetical protein [Streptomyces]|nr:MULTISPECIES: hypothetical protein [Streptomyces]